VADPDLELDLPWPRTSADTARLWDTVTLDGEEWPGLAEVDAEITRRIQRRRARGRDGGRITDGGLDPTEVPIVFKAWKPEHFTALRALIPRLLARRRLADRTPMDVYHPALAVLGITQLYAKTLGAVKPSGQAGMWEMRVTFIEYFQPPRRAVTRTVTAPASGLGGIASVGINTNTAGDKTPRANGGADP
jgi:hypothetical protein